MGKHLFKILGLFVAAGALVGVVTLTRQTRVTGDNAPLPIFASETQPPTISSDVLSPDGKVTIAMREVRVEAGILHTFSVGGKEIFSKTLPKDTRLTIPYNAFSPDNKYIFLEESGSAGNIYFVVPLAGGEAIDVSGPFTQKFGSELAIEEATGWGGMNLLVVNSTKTGGGKGPSFWFEVPSGAFIRLSHAF